jgi:ribosome-associated protein
MFDDLVVKAGLVIPASELGFSAVRSSGPGGQNVNKVSTKVELRFDFVASRALDASVKARLAKLAAGRLDSEGRILITAQSTRSQLANRVEACEKLAELVRRALVAPKKRRPTRPSRASKERRLESKRQRGERKRARRAKPDD